MAMTRYTSCAIGVTVVALNAVIATAQPYSVTDLGTLGGRTSTATGINASGQVVGSSSLMLGDGTPVHAFLYAGGKMMDLGTLGSTRSSASAINALGQVV